MGAAEDHCMFPMERRSNIVYPKPVPIAWGTRAAFVRAVGLFALADTKFWYAVARAEVRAVESVERICDFWSAVRVSNLGRRRLTRGSK